MDRHGLAMLVANLATTHAAIRATQSRLGRTMSHSPVVHKHSGHLHGSSDRTDRAGNAFSGVPSASPFAAHGGDTTRGAAQRHLRTYAYSNRNRRRRKYHLRDRCCDPVSSATVADSAGNTYTKDAEVANGTGTTGVRTLVFSAVTTRWWGHDYRHFTSPTPAEAACFFSFNDLFRPPPIKPIQELEAAA